MVHTCRYIDYYRFPLSYFAQTIATRAISSLGNCCTHTSANLTSACHSEPTVNDECPRTSSVAGGAPCSFDSGLQSRTRTRRAIDNRSHLDRLLGALARVHEGNPDCGLKVRPSCIIGVCTSTTSEATSKQLFEQIRLGALGSIKERIEPPSPEPSEATTEGVTAECIGIKPWLLRRVSILVVPCALLVVLEDLSYCAHDSVGPGGDR